MTLISLINDLISKLKKNSVTINNFTYTKPLSEEELILFEKSISFPVPKPLRDIYLYEASSLSFNWSVVEPKVFGEECTRGEFVLLSTSEVLEMYDEMISIV
ncbi:hypothetical protein N6H14_13395 [Paenibacillus sp. CC-CFT747]|nr:hypothetical protein N6H14_13395 [Paenibacillus sp. CC-CFT747]